MKALQQKIIEQSGTIANAIAKGRDVEIRKSASGISIAEVQKKVVAK